MACLHHILYDNGTCSRSTSEYARLLHSPCRLYILHCCSADVQSCWETIDVSQMTSQSLRLNLRLKRDRYYECYPSFASTKLAALVLYVFPRTSFQSWVWTKYCILNVYDWYIPIAFPLKNSRCQIQPTTALYICCYNKETNTPVL